MRFRSKSMGETPMPLSPCTPKGGGIRALASFRHRLRSNDRLLRSLPSMSVTTGTSSPRSPGRALPAGFGAYLLWGDHSPLFQTVEPRRANAHGVAYARPSHRLERRLPFTAALAPGSRERASAAAGAQRRTLASVCWQHGNDRDQLARLHLGRRSEHRVMDASLGYFINPLVNVGLGMIFLGKPLHHKRNLSPSRSPCGCDDVGRASRALAVDLAGIS